MQRGSTTPAMVILKDAASSRGAEVHPRELESYFTHGIHLPHLGIILADLTRETVLRLSRDENRVEAVLGVPSLASPLAGQSPAWGISALKADQVPLTGKGVRVGHLDSGVDTAHPVLGSGKVERFAVIDRYGYAYETDPFDAGWHGTHTAATIAGWSRPGKARIGVAPDAALACAVVFDSHTDVRHSFARLLGGMNWAVEQGIRVLNMSVGIPAGMEDPNGFSEVIRVLRARGVLPVCAIGNDGAATSIAPGNYSGVLSVGASHRDGELWYQSGSTPSLIAPGVAIISAFPTTRRGGDWAVASGTSAAAAHIAGLAALLLEAPCHPTVADVERAILDSCVPNGDPRRAGRGIPDAQRALALLER